MHNMKLNEKRGMISTANWSQSYKGQGSESLSVDSSHAGKSNQVRAALGGSFHK